MEEASNLHLYEELMLLALRDDKGTLEADHTAFIYTVAAALISELLLSQHFVIEQVKENKHIIDIRKFTRTGDPLLDECIAKVKNAKRRASVTTWVTRIAGIKNLKHHVALQLCHRGILRNEEDKVLLVFTRKIYPELNPRPEREVVERLRHAIFTDTMDLTPRTSVLVALADKAGVLKNAFDKHELKRRKHRLKQIAEGEFMAKATQDVIDSVNAAVMVAVLMPAMVPGMAGH